MMRVWFCPVRRTDVATYLDPFFVFVKTASDKNLCVDSTY